MDHFGDARSPQAQSQHGRAEIWPGVSLLVSASFSRLWGPGGFLFESQLGLPLCLIGNRFSGYEGRGMPSGGVE